MAGGVRAVFGGFEGEAWGCSESDGVFRITWLVFVGGDMARLAEY